MMRHVSVASASASSINCCLVSRGRHCTASFCKLTCSAAFSLPLCWQHVRSREM